MNSSISLDKMIKKAANIVIEDDINFLNEADASDVVFSRSFSAKMSELFEEAKSESLKKKPRRLKIISRLSVAVFSVLLAFIMVFPSLYPAILSFTKSHDDTIQYPNGFWKGGSSKLVLFLKPSVKIFRRKNPSYVPEGLELTEKKYDKHKYDKRYELTYEDENGDGYLKYIQVFKGFKSPDIDGYTEKSTIKIGKQKATVAIKTENGKQSICIYWNDSTYHYEIYSNLPLEEVTKIAKSIK